MTKRKPAPEVQMESTGDDIFIVFNGVRIACAAIPILRRRKRGYR